MHLFTAGTVTSCCSLIVKGYKKALEREDLWSLNECDTSGAVVPQFEKHWNTELIKNIKYVRPPSFSLLAPVCVCFSMQFQVRL